jgi:poly-gamma-glutamate synthesis protein (capsule biosynthesis protein)
MEAEARMAGTKVSADRGWMALGLCLVLAGCQFSTAQQPEAFRTPVSAHLPVVLGELRLVAVGDVMMHADVKKAAEDQGGFAPLWADLAPLFTGADLAFANLETPVAPSTGRPGQPYQFNAPEALPAALRASGLTVLSTANNHAYDQGRNGVKETLDRLADAKLVAIGSGASKAAAEAPRFFEANGVKVALLAFTDLFNMDLNRKSDEPWVRPMVLDAAVQEVQALRAQVDAVVVSVHWGDEYHHLPTKRHRGIAEALVGAGADLVIGHHPHVLQPVELLEAGGRTGLVAFSLGNFISNMDRMYRADLFPVAGGDARDGAALLATFSKCRMPDGSVKVILGEVRYEPLWVENNWRDLRAGKGNKREIRVIRVREALTAVRRELDTLTDPVEGPKALGDDKARKALIIEKQERLRTLLLRKARIAAVVGSGFEAR